jgi:hypothetical protein
VAQLFATGNLEGIDYDISSLSPLVHVWVMIGTLEVGEQIILQTQSTLLSQMGVDAAEQQTNPDVAKTAKVPSM